LIRKDIIVGHKMSVNCIDYYNATLYSGSRDMSFCIWDIFEKKLQIKYNTCYDSITGIKYSKYHYLHKREDTAIMSYGNYISIYDIKSKKISESCKLSRYGVHDIAISSFNDGQYVCAATFDKNIKLVNLVTKKISQFDGHMGSVWSIDFSPLNTKEIFKGHEGNVLNVRYPSCGPNINEFAATIISGSSDKTMRLWDVRSGTQICVFKGHQHFVTAVEYIPYFNNVIDGGCVICSASADEHIFFWDIGMNKILNKIKANSGIRCMKLLGSNKGSEICCGFDDGKIIIFG
ncbi:hypothetical protein RFI_03286, partial [Reticulomyxa filosa]